MTRNQKYKSSLNGFATTAISRQIASSTRRGHTKPTYSKDELIEWLSDNNFNTISQSWIDSGFEKDMCPSIDRLDNSIGYNINNIELVTWLENKKRSYEYYRHHGTGVIQSKPVEKYSLNNEYIETYYSLSEAARKVNGQKQAIKLVCGDFSRTAYNFKWKFE